MTDTIKVRASIGVTPYLTRIEFQSGSFTVDEPTTSGGQELGPTPHEILASSLASCMAITLRMYCNRKQLSVDEINVEVTIKKKSERTLFDTYISFHGEVDQATRERLLQIAKACPVHKILSHPIDIETNLV